MARRSSDISVVCVALSPRERIVCNDMRAMLGIASDSEFCRLGLWHLAKHCDLDTSVFVARKVRDRSATSARRRATA